MNDNASTLDDQHALTPQNLKNTATIDNSESSSSFKSFDFDSNSVLEQLLCFSPATPVQNSDSDPEYLPSKKPCKSAHASADRPKSTCRRSARLSTFKDEHATLFSLPLATSEDPEYLPPKGILYALQKSVSDAVPKSDIITNVKQRKLRRSKKLVDPACNGCNGNAHEKLLTSCNKVQSNLSMSSSPLSTEQLRQILEDSTFEEVLKEEKETHAEVVQEVQLNHDSKGIEDIAEDTTVKMPRTRSSLKLKVKKKDKKVNFIISATAKSDKELNNEVGDACPQYKVSKDEVLPKIHIHKESKRVLKKRKRQTCRKQFRHKDITLYKLGADPDPVNEATQKNHVIHKIFLRRSSVSTPPATPQTSKVNKNEEVSENVFSNTYSNGDNKCPENITVKENNNFKINNSNCDLSNSNKIYCSSISIENHNMNKVPKVILTPINHKDSYYQKSAMLKDEREATPQPQINHEKTQDVTFNFKKDLAGQGKLNRNEVGKHNLPIRIPERRTSIAEPLRTPPTPNNKVPIFHAEFQAENQFDCMKIQVKNKLSENQEVIYVKPAISQEKVVDIKKPTENSSELSATVSVAPSIVCKPLHNESIQSSIKVSKEHLNTKENDSLPVINNADNIVRREVVNNLPQAKPTQKSKISEQAETYKNVSQETREAGTFSGPQNLSIKVVKSCSGITDPLKLHKTCNLPSKKTDSDVKSKINSVTLPKENHGIDHRRTDDPNCSTAQKNPSMNSNETPHKSPSILQQNLLNGPIFKSDVYRNTFHNRGNISLNNFNSELSSYALNSLAMHHLRAPHSNTVSNVSRNMPIIEESNQKISNDKVTYETCTPPVATDSSKKAKKGKRKLPRSDMYDEISPKLQRTNNHPNYPNYPSYNYPLSFYSGVPANSPYNPLSPFPLGIPHSIYNMVPPVYQPKPSNCTGQPPTFDRTGFRSILPPPLINPFLSHDSHLPVPSYPSSNPPVCKPYDPHVPYNHFLHVSNPMYVNHNTLPPDYGSVGINNRRNEALPQNTHPTLQQSFNVPSKNVLRIATRQSPQQILPPTENAHRRSTEATEPQSTPLALIKSTTPTQSNDWSNIPMASRNEELTITKLPLRESLPKPTHVLTMRKICSPGHQVEDLTVQPKQSDFRQTGGNACSMVAVSKSNIKNTDSSTHPCSKTNASQRLGGVGSVLHSELANVSISLIKNKNENLNKPTPLAQQGMLPMLERTKFLQDIQRISVPQTTKACEVGNSHPTPIQNVQSGTTLGIQKNDPKFYVAASETNKHVSAGQAQSLTSNSKTTSPANIYRDIELEINSTKITKPIKNISNNNTNCSPINAKTSLANTLSRLHNDPKPKLENKIGVTASNRKVDQNASPLSNLESNAVAKLKNERSSSVDTKRELASPSRINKTAEAVNLSIDKPEISSATVVGGQNKNVTTNTPKSSNINAIASIMQDIIHHGDVNKFDQYVVALRRSLEHRDIPKLDPTKQAGSENLFAKIAKAREKYAECNSEHAAVSGKVTTSANSGKPSNNMISKTAATTEHTKPQIVNSLSSEKVAATKPVRDLTNTLVPRSSLEPEHTNAKVCRSENVASADTRNTIDSHNSKPYKHIDKQVSQTEVIPEHLNAQIPQCEVNSESIVASKNTLVPQCVVASEPGSLHNKPSPQSENVITSENIENSNIQTAVACERINTQASQTGAIPKNITTKTDKNATNTEDSGKIQNSLNVGSNDNSNNVAVAESTEGSRTTIDSPRMMTSQGVNTQAVNSENVPVPENTEISRSAAVSQTPVSEPGNAQTLVPEDVTTMAELLAVEIKKEVEDDDDVTFVWASNSRVATSTEDKGIQADISTLLPLNSNTNHLKAPTRKRKKWKFLETTNSTKVPKTSKSRTQGVQKGKASRKSRNKTNGTLLSKQSDNQSSQENQAALTCEDEQNPFRIRSSRLENTKIEAKEIVKLSPIISTKSCQTADNKFSDDGSQLSKTSTITFTKPCKTVNNRLSSDDSQISKTSSTTSSNQCESENNAHSSTTTKPCKTVNNRLSSDDSQISKTSSTTSSNQCEFENNAHSGDGYQTSKTSTASTTTKPCQTTTTTKLSEDGCQVSKTVNTSTKPCQISKNNLSDDGSHVSNKSSKRSSVNKRSSKRLMLKKGMKTYANKETESLHASPETGNPQSTEEASSEPANVKQSEPCAVAAAVEELPTSENITNVNYTLRNSEITRCFVRLSRILETSKMNNNQTNDSKASIDVEEKEALHKACDLSVPDFQPTSNLVQRTPEVSSLGGTSSDCSTFRYGSSTNEITNDPPQALQKPSSLSITPPHSFDITKCGNEVETSENTSMYLPETNKVTSAIQLPQKLPSPNKALPQIIGTPSTINRVSSDNQAPDNGIQIPQNSSPENKLLQQTVISPAEQITNESVEIPHKFSDRMSPKAANILPAGFRSHGNQTVNSARATPQKPPSVLSAKKISSSSSDTCKGVINKATNNAVQISQKLPSLNKSSPHNDFVQLPQKSLPANEFSKQVSIPSTYTYRVGSNNDQNVNNSSDKLQQLHRLRTTSSEPLNTTSSSGSNDNQAEKNLVQEPTKPAPLNKLSKQSHSSSSNITKTASSTTQVNNSLIHTPPSPIGAIPSAKGANINDFTINNSVQMKQMPMLTSHSNGNHFNQNNNYSVHVLQQSSLARRASQISDSSSATFKDVNNTSSNAQMPQQTSSRSRTSPQVAETPTVIQENNSFQAAQQSQSLSQISQQTFRSLPKNSKSANGDGYTIRNLTETPQKSPSVIKSLKGSDVTNNSISTSKGCCRRTSTIANSSIEIPQKSPSSTGSLLQGFNPYDTLQTTKDSASRIFPRSSNTINYSGEIAQKSPSSTRTVPQNYNTHNSAQIPNDLLSRRLPPGSLRYSVEVLQKQSLQGTSTANNPVPISQKSPSSSQMSVNNSVKTVQNSPYLNRTLPQDSGTTSAALRCINSEQASIKSYQVPQKSPNTSNTFQQAFSAPTEFYRYGNNGYQISNNSTPVSCSGMSPQFANTSSADNKYVQTPHKTSSVGRTSYQISPPIAHRRASGSNKTTNSLLNATSGQVSSGLSDIYKYGNRNMECEIDLTTSSKPTSREEANNRPGNKKDPKALDPKVPKRNLSNYEEENSMKSVSSDSMTYQPPSPFYTDTTPFRFYPPYTQKTSENRPHNQFTKKIQGNSTEHPPISFPTNQEMRQNSYSSSSSSSSQFSPVFRQPSPVQNKVYTKTVNSKQATEAKNKDSDLRNSNAALREHVSYTSGPPSEPTNFCEIQKSPSSGAAAAFADPKEKCATLGKSMQPGTGRSPEIPHKKVPKEEQNYLNIKQPDARHFNGNLSPDYGYFSPLTKNTAPNFESVVYRPNPIHFNEANSFHNYHGTASQHTRETYHQANAALPVQNSNSAYVRQNSKLPPNTATLPMANGVQHNVQQPDVDKISSILPKLQQGETLNPEQYVLEMNVLEKDGCPRPFLEFYSFVTKKQISSNQLPISFRIFLEFQNAGKLKNFENAFRVYSERHETEKKLMLNTT